MRKVILIILTLMVFAGNAIAQDLGSPNPTQNNLEIKIEKSSEALLKEVQDKFTDRDWVTAEENAKFLSSSNKNSPQGIPSLQGLTLNRSCNWLCSKSKQHCEPTDLSPCHGTGGTCKKYCW